MGKVILKCSIDNIDAYYSAYKQVCPDSPEDELCNSMSRFLQDIAERALNQLGVQGSVENVFNVGQLEIPAGAINTPPNTQFVEYLKKDNCPPPGSPPASTPIATPLATPANNTSLFQSLGHALSAVGKTIRQYDQKLGESWFGQGIQDVNLAMYQSVNSLLNFIPTHAEAIVYVGVAGVILVNGVRNGNSNTAQAAGILNRSGQVLSRYWLGR